MPIVPDVQLFGSGPLLEVLPSVGAAFDSVSGNIRTIESNTAYVGVIAKARLKSKSAIVDRSISGCYLVCTSTGSNPLLLHNLFNGASHNFLLLSGHNGLLLMDGIPKHLVMHLLQLFGRGNLSIPLLKLLQSFLDLQDCKLHGSWM